jgi:hypothetical protein
VTAPNDGRPPGAPEVSSTSDSSHGRPTARPVLLRAVPSVLVNGALSTAVYFLLRQILLSDLFALALTGAIPALWTLFRFGRHRTVDPIGVLAFVGYALAVLATLLSGGSPLALELHEPALTGALGLACLVSVAVGRPLHGWLVRLLAHRDLAPQRVGAARRRMSVAITLLVGGTLVIHAAALVALALLLPPGSYMALRHPVGLPILGLGAAAVVWYRNHRHPATGHR